MMNLYLVEREYCDWDEIDSCVLVAESEEQAIDMMLNMCVDNHMGETKCYADREELTVTLLGTVNLIETPTEPKVLHIQTKDG